MNLKFWMTGAYSAVNLVVERLSVAGVLLT